MAEQPRPTETTGDNTGEFNNIMGRASEQLADDMARDAQASDRDRAEADDSDEDELPPLTEQVAQQLGGIRGLIESGVPVGVFVLVNVIFDDALYWAIGASVAVAMAIAIVRLLRKQPIRHALNGLFGIAAGAIIAWKTGETEDFYVPGIIQGLVYGVGLMGSVAVRHPAVGWMWSVVAGGGTHSWREDDRLVRTFGWITMVWGAVFLLKNIVRAWLHYFEYSNALGLMTLLGGYPLTALLFLLAFWGVRRVRPGMVLNLKGGKETAST